MREKENDDEDYDYDDDDDDRVGDDDFYDNKKRPTTTTMTNIRATQSTFTSLRKKGSLPPSSA